MMTELNERVEILDDVRISVSLALDAANKAPVDVKELDFLAYADVIDSLNGAIGLLGRLHSMAKLDAERANKADDAYDRVINERGL
jgi:hypothetical protein